LLAGGLVLSVDDVEIFPVPYVSAGELVGSVDVYDECGVDILWGVVDVLFELLELAGNCLHFAREGVIFV
jgi:hypothetical protein